MSSAPPLAVLGAGSWGTALAVLLSKGGRSVTLWSREQGQLSTLSTDRCNAQFLPGIQFPNSLSIAPSNDLNSLAGEFEHFLLVVPSHAFREVVSVLYQSRQQQNKLSKPISLLWGTKGFDPNTGKLLSTIVHEIFADLAISALITGPSFAKETALGLPTALVLACEDTEHAETFAHWFKTPSTRIYASSDLIGAQIGGATKNVMAVAAGISDGLGFGANTRAALITRGLAEMTRLGMRLGGEAETFMGLAGMGDLILTCTDDQSRNRRLGLGVGAGRDIQDVIREIGQEVEGYHTAKELHHRAQALGVSMPICEQVYAVLYEGRDPKQGVRTLLERQVTSER